MEKLELQRTSTSKDGAQHKLESSAKSSRIQNLHQGKNELLSEPLAPLLSITLWELALEFDHAYRHHTVVTRKGGKVFVKFIRRFMRNTVLKVAQDKELKTKDNKIHILKDIQWFIRQQRKEYSFLTKLLIDKKIQYKWLFPEGLSLMWDGKLVRLDLIIKGKRIATKSADKLGYQPSSEDSSSKVEAQPGDDQQSVSGQAVAGVWPKLPRALRQRTAMKKNINIEHRITENLLLEFKWFKLSPKSFLKKLHLEKEKCDLTCLQETHIRWKDQRLLLTKKTLGTLYAVFAETKKKGFLYMPKQH